jgi:F0F1-type ATP synthase assembly protein I
VSDSGQQKDPFESVRKQIDQIRADAGEPAPTPEIKYNVDVPDLPDLSHVEKRSEKIRNEKVFPQKGNANRGMSSAQDGNYYRGVGIGFAILYAFVGPILAGIGIGWFIDRGNKGSSAIVWGALIGTLCGFIGGIVTVVRLTTTGPKE